VFPIHKGRKAVLSCVCEDSVAKLQKQPFKLSQTEAPMLRCTPRSAVRRKRDLQSLAGFPTPDLRARRGEFGL
jgi:hypothetical protein